MGMQCGKDHISPKPTYEYSEKLSSKNGIWFISNEEIKPDGNYLVALTDFLLTGGESNLGFLTDKNTDIIKIYPVSTDINDPKTDIRLAIIQYLLKL